MINIEIEHDYNKCGWRVKYLTETAVSDHDGVAKFYTDLSYVNFEYGGGIISPDENWLVVENQEDQLKIPFKEVKLIRLSDFMKYAVANRKIPLLNSSLYPPFTTEPKVRCHYQYKGV